MPSEGLQESRLISATSPSRTTRQSSGTLVSARINCPLNPYLQATRRRLRQCDLDLDHLNRRRQIVGGFTKLCETF